ncbi:MAG TPA: carboxypeptidase regulatory-like domain-containing protein, partial [Blastocatellia bacterium]|nr:carboxypeptidase regulatory-like domain-containing protein [Blastocatellia bacterium]
MQSATKTTRRSCVFSRALIAVLLATLLVGGYRPVAAAQVPTGSIEGTVTDANGAVIPDAKVIVTQRARGRQFSTTSNSKGSYAVNALEPGEYEVKFTGTGFKSALLTLKVEVGEAASGNITLEIGQLSETVTVAASDSTQLDLSRNTVSGVVSTREIEGLPLNGRNFLDLASLEPGVQTVDGGSFDPTKNGFAGISVAGGEGRTTRIQVDGIDITDETVGTTVQNYSLDSLQEFQISQFSLDPSTSLSNTGAVNVATRSGDNNLHGSAFLFSRDHHFAARVGQQDAPFDRQQGGFRLGGPVKRDRLFWFANFEHNNQDSSTFLSPPAPFDKFAGFAASPFDERFGAGRLDWNATDRTHVFARFSHNANKGVTGFGGNDLAPFQNSNNTNSLVLGADLSLTRFTHSARYGHVNFANYINPAAPEGIPDVPVFVQFDDTGVQFGPDFLAPQHTLQTNDQFRYDGSFSHRSHLLRYGADYNHITVNLFAAFVGQAPIVDTLSTLNSGDDPANPLNYFPIDIVFGNGLGFFSEKPNHGYQFGGVENNRFAWYLSDSWKARRDVTLNFGVRWEIDPGQVNDDLARPAILDSVAPGESRNVRLDKNNFAPTAGFAWDIKGRGTTVVRGGSGVYYTTNIFNNVIFERASLLPNTIAPAFPFVFDAPGFNILRGPNGEFVFDFTSVSSSPISATISEILAAQAQLQALSRAATSSFPNGPISLLPPDGLPGTQNTAGPIFASEFSQPYSIQMNIGVQRRLGNNWILQADYVRNRGVHSLLVRDYNRVGAADTLD